MDRRRRGLPIIGLLVVGLAGACGGSSGDAGTTVTSAATTTTLGTTPTTARETTTTKPAGQGDVDLRFTGTYVLQVKGKYGECKVAGGMFGFSMTGDDVPGIGKGFSVTQLSAANGEIEWVIDDNNAYANSTEAKLTFSANGKSVEIDDQLTPRNTQGGTQPRPERVVGTISCP
jgi:hypothetical protein